MAMNLKELLEKLTNKPPITVDFKQHLNRQLKFLEASCHGYDSGNREESIRIAVALRVLFHDTQHSISLLTHLQLKNSVQILSTYEIFKPKPTVKHFCITSFPDEDGHFIPPLDKSYWKELMPAQDWWEQVIMSPNEVLSRKKIILAAANEDGGAHVADKPSPVAKELIQGTFYYSINRGGGVFETKAIENQHFSIIRQFAYEVLNSPDITNILACSATTPAVPTEPKSQA